MAGSARVCLDTTGMVGKFDRKFQFTRLYGVQRHLNSRDASSHIDRIIPVFAQTGCVWRMPGMAKIWILYNSEKGLPACDFESKSTCFFRAP